jgi:tetratricopeptide (TPR) repeat protein
MPVIQEFQISITPVQGARDPDSYLIRTEAVAKGVPLAESQVTWPVATWLEETARLSQDPLQRLLTATAGDRWLPSPEANPSLALGQELYQQLFQGRLRDSWLAAQGVAHHRQQPLRLRLGFKDSRLQSLPWELLYGDDRPLATGMDITLCRYYYGQNAIDLTNLPALPAPPNPLEVLVVIAAPDDQERLALSYEIEHLQRELEAPSPVSASQGGGRLNRTEPIPIQLTLLLQPDRSELVAALEQGNFRVLHYAGHSDVSESGGDLFLVNRHTGLTEILSGEDLAGLLVNNGIWLAVFNSCRGAYTDEGAGAWHDQNLVQALVNRGVPAVLAMAERIPDDVAITFTQLLYRNLRQGYAIDLCLSRVRQGLTASHRLLPRLYLRPGFDGYLYAAEAQPLEELLGDMAPLDSLLPLADYGDDPEIADLAKDLFATTAYPALQPLTEEAEPLLEGAEAGSSDSPAVNPPMMASSPLSAAAPALLPEAPVSTSMPGDWATTPPGLPGPASPPPITPERPRPGPSMTWRRWRWAGLGVASLMALTGLMLVVPRWRSAPPQPELSPPSSAPPLQPGGEATVQALKALNNQDLSRTRRLLEQQLDQGDLRSVQAVLGAAQPHQLEAPDLAFIRGRLAWQQSRLEGAETSPSDALRAWLQATQARPDFLEAWVALGFAHYVLAEDDQAQAAWERALDLDKKQLRRVDPDGQQRVASPYTVNAMAGLAMVNHRQAEETIDAHQDRHRRAASSYFLLVTSTDPSILDTSVLAQRWLWTPTLIQEWQTYLGQLRS